MKNKCCGKRPFWDQLTSDATPPEPCPDPDLYFPTFQPDFSNPAAVTIEANFNQTPPDYPDWWVLDASYSVDGGARVTIPLAGDPIGSPTIGPWDSASTVFAFWTNSLRPDCPEASRQIW